MVLAAVARVVVVWALAWTALGWGLSLGCTATTASLGLAPRFEPWPRAWSGAWAWAALGWGLSLGRTATTASLGLAPRFGPWAWARAGTWCWVRPWAEPPGGSARLWRVRALLLSCLSSSSLLLLRALLALSASLLAAFVLAISSWTRAGLCRMSVAP